MKLEEILKKRGWTDEELKANETLLANPKFRMSLEEEYGAIASERDSLSTNLQKEKDYWAEWHQKEAIPTIDQYAKDRADAVAEAAGLKARLALAEAAGFVPGSGAPAADPTKAPPAAAAADPAFDPKKHNLVTMSDIDKFAEAEGRAIALAADLQEEYRMLTGGNLMDYSTTIDGRVVRGMSALRMEALQQRKNLDQYVSEKFDFMGKRTAKEAERKAAERLAMKKDLEAEIIKERGLPGAGIPMPSRFPFIPKKESTTGQPWEKTPGELRERRLNHAWETESKARLQ